MRRFPPVLPLMLVNGGVEAYGAEPEQVAYFVRIMDQRGFVYPAGSGNTLMEALQELAEDAEDPRGIPTGQAENIRRMIANAITAAKGRAESYLPAAGSDRITIQGYCGNCEACGSEYVRIEELMTADIPARFRVCFDCGWETPL